jgi:hypothetical protein
MTGSPVEKTTPQDGPEQLCRCGKQPGFATSLVDPRTGKRYRIFQCGHCGAQTWSE